MSKADALDRERVRERVLPFIRAGLGRLGRNREAELAVADALDADRLLQLDRSYIQAIENRSAP